VSADGTVRIERISADAECDGLVPSSAPAAVTAAVVPEAPRASCSGWGSVSDGTGHLALNVYSQRTGTLWQAFTPSGAPREKFWTTGRAPFPQPEGWIGSSVCHGSFVDCTFAEATAYFSDGRRRASVRVERSYDSPIGQAAVSEDPLGGALLVHSWHDMDGSGRCGGDARRVDAAGALRGAPAEIGCWTVGAGVSKRGEALVLEGRWNPSARAQEVYVRWLRADGTPAAAPALEGRTEDLYGAGAFVELVPLLDGSLAVRYGDRWTRRYPHLAARGEAAPSWLAALSGWRFRNTRGNRGYAFFPAGGESPDCSQTVDLRAPSGRLCGKVTLVREGGACWTAHVDQGWDGTVVQGDVRDPCTWRWWPRLLAGE
jgi:hypothetical protein